MRSTADAICKNCQTLFENLPLDDDEDGSYVALEVAPCAICTAMLCRCCAAFACDGCGETFCAEHAVTVPDGTPNPLRCCPACASECEQYRFPAYCIATAALCPPVPCRESDWQAWIDGEEDGVNGFGATQAEAVADLLEQLEAAELEALPLRIEPARETRIAAEGQVA